MDKVIDATRIQLLRGQTLILCCEAGQNGVGADVIAGILKKERHYETKAEAERSVAHIFTYLADEGLIKIDEVKNEVLGIKRDIAKITAKGIDALEGTKVYDGIML